VPGLSTGVIGVGVAPTTAAALTVGTPSGATAFLHGLDMDITAPATATTFLAGVKSVLRTAAVAFTLGTMVHFSANSAMKGAGSSITTVKGFDAANAIAVGTNNYGFYSDIANAAGTYQMYLTGSAPVMLFCAIGTNGSIGPTSSAAFWTVPSTINNGTSQIHNVTATWPSTTTGTGSSFISTAGTAAAAFTLANLHHFAAASSSVGAGSTISVVRGFHAANAIAVGGTNYGFYTDLAASAGTKYGFYSASSAENFFGGPVGIFSNNTPLASGALLKMGNGSAVHPATVASIYSIQCIYSAPSTATTLVAGVSMGIQTQNSVFTITDMHYFDAGIASAKGASSTITNVRGFYARNNIALGTNNYGFFSDIAAASTNYQLYMSGTAQSRFSGPVGILNDPGSAMLLIGNGNAHPSTISSIYGGYSYLVAPATATVEANAFYARLDSAASAFTIANLALFKAHSVIKGAGSTITAVRGFYAANAIAAGTNNYGFFSDINSAATTYQLYMSGTALNFIKGGLILDTTVAPIVAAGQVGLGATTATTATAGANGAVPAQVAGYLIANVAGTQVKIPYFAN
jgi:hypothetical protein